MAAETLLKSELTCPTCGHRSLNRSSSRLGSPAPASRCRAGVTMRTTNDSRMAQRAAASAIRSDLPARSNPGWNRLRSWKQTRSAYPASGSAAHRVPAPGVSRDLSLSRL